MNTTTTKGDTMNTTEAKILTDFATALSTTGDVMKAAHTVCIDYRDAVAAKRGQEAGIAAFYVVADTIAAAIQKVTVAA
jgi:hypothetical protein